MATIMPFRALRYDTAKAGTELKNLISMPYDRIKHELQDVYYSRSNYNICRVIKNKPESPEPDSIYPLAADNWRKWVSAGIVKQDNDPAIYAYYQTFKVDGKEYTRRGMCVQVELEDYSSGKVKAHEKTLEGPKADRLKLLKATHTHFGQIFQLYPDDTNEVANLIGQYTQGEPLMAGEIPEEEAYHQVWAITDPTVIKRVQELMNDKLLFIADGHHRYETCLNYRNWVAETHNLPDNSHSPRYAMMTLVGMSDPGLIVLPTLRILHSIPTWDLNTFLDKLTKHFIVSEEPSIDSMQTKLDSAASDKSRNAYGLYCDGRYWYFELKDHAIMNELAPEHTEDWRGLDVAVLHEVVLEKLLGITKEAQAAKANLSYERERARAKGLVDDSSHHCLIYMNPTLLSQIRNVAGKGEVMPQKSTDFFPKLLDGFCACPVDLGTAK
jgi:uncharacterized protein (DUF1015 family)